jgi:hypothetical protein
MEAQKKDKRGRKSNPDKKVLTGIYHRPSEIQLIGGAAKYKEFVYQSVNAEIEKLKAATN